MKITHAMRNFFTWHVNFIESTIIVIITKYKARGENFCQKMNAFQITLSAFIFNGRGDNLDIFLARNLKFYILI